MRNAQTSRQRVSTGMGGAEHGLLDRGAGQVRTEKHVRAGAAVRRIVQTLGEGRCRVWTIRPPPYAFGEEWGTLIVLHERSNDGFDLTEPRP